MFGFNVYLNRFDYKLSLNLIYDIFGNVIIKILDKYPEWKSNVYGDEPREKLFFNHKNLK